MNNRFFNYAEVFVSVVNNRSVTSSARELKTTKSNVSQKLTEFEALLGQKLLIRTTRSIDITPAGKRIFAVCKDAVDQTSLAVAHLTSLSGIGEEPSGNVTVSGSNVYLTNYIIPLMDDFLTHHPKVKPIFIGNDRKVDFAAENVDLGFRIGEQASSEHFATVMNPLDRLLCANPKLFDAHNLPRHPRDLAKLPCILREQEKPTWKLSCDGKEEIVRVTAPHVLVNTIELALKAVVMGWGVALMTTLVAEEKLRAKNLIQILPDWTIEPIPVTMLTRSSRLHRPQVAALHNYLVRTLKP